MYQHCSIHTSWDASEQDQTSLECTNSAQPIQEHAELLILLPHHRKEPFHHLEK